MGTKYSGNSTSGYNSSPPSDDGTVSEANKVKYSTLKTKLTDPVKTLAEEIDSDLTTHFDHGPTALTANTTLDASHYEKFVQVSGAGVTLTLSDASNLGAAWNCWIANTDSSNSVTLGRTTVGDTINGAASNYTIPPGTALFIFVVAAANGFRVVANVNTSGSNNFSVAQTFSAGTGAIVLSTSSINEAKGADIASSGTTNIGAATGNAIDVTGTTTITALGTVQAGTRRVVRFTGALTLTHNATSLILPGGANITTANGDTATFISLGSGNWYCASYSRASGFPVIQPAFTYIASGAEAAVASFTITGLSSTYRAYMVVLDKAVPVSDGVVLRVRLGAGSTDSAASDYAWDVFGRTQGTAGDTIQSNADDADSEIEITRAANFGSDTNERGSGRITIFNPSDSGQFTQIESVMVYENVSGAIGRDFACAQRLAAQADDRIEISFSSGNVETMNWVLYGMRASV